MCRYDGEFRAHKKNGHGRLEMRNGTVLEGMFVADLPNGLLKAKCAAPPERPSAGAE